MFPTTFEWIIVLIILAVFILPYILYLSTLNKALLRCSTVNRDLEPGNVWLLLIPIFNIYWQFVVISKIASSLEKEYRSRSMDIEKEPGKSLGFAYCILFIISIIPLIGFLAGLAGLIVWVMYWGKISNYSSALALAPKTI